MKFQCLTCAETVLEQSSVADAKQCLRDNGEFTDAIRASGHFLGCNRLLSPKKVITLRPRNGATTTDGAVAEAKEQLGAYYLIETCDLNEAIQVAARIPGAWYGCVEIRPVARDEPTLKATGKVARSNLAVLSPNQRAMDLLLSLHCTLLTTMGLNHV